MSLCLMKLVTSMAQVLEFATFLQSQMQVSLLIGDLSPSMEAALRASIVMRLAGAWRGKATALRQCMDNALHQKKAHVVAETASLMTMMRRRNSSAVSCEKNPHSACLH